MSKAFRIVLVGLLGLALYAGEAKASHSPAEVKRAIVSVFGDGLAGQRALITADCENDFNQEAPGALGEVSTFQFHPVHWYRHWQLYRPRRVAYITPEALIRYPRLAANLAFTMSSGGRHWGAWYNCAVAHGLPL